MSHGGFDISLVNNRSIYTFQVLVDVLASSAAELGGGLEITLTRGVTCYTGFIGEEILLPIGHEEQGLIRTELSQLHLVAPLRACLAAMGAVM